MALALRKGDEATSTLCQYQSRYPTETERVSLLFLTAGRVSRESMDRIGAVLAYRKMSLIMEEVSVPTPVVYSIQ